LFSSNLDKMYGLLDVDMFCFKLRVEQLFFIDHYSN